MFHFIQQFQRMQDGGLQYGHHGGGGMGGHSTSSHGTSHGSTRGSGGGFGGSHSRSPTGRSRSHSKSNYGSFGKGKDTYGGYKSNVAGVGLGTSAHAGFSKAVGSNYSGGEGGSRAKSSYTAASIDRHTFSQVAASTDYGLNKYTSVGSLTGSGTASDVWSGVKGFFTEDNYATPTDAFKEYGFQREEYSQTAFNDRSYSEQWSEDSVRTVGNLMKNPMVSGAMWATGLGAINVGTQLAATAKDMIEGDVDMTKGLGSIASTLVSSTPLGDSLGQFKGVVSAGLQDVANIPSAFGKLAGSHVGAELGAGIAGTINANPYIGAGLTALSSVAGAVLGSKGAKYAMAEASNAPTSTLASQISRNTGKGASPLVSSGKLALDKSQSMVQDTDVTKYARQVDLPFYGNILTPNFNSSLRA